MARQTDITPTVESARTINRRPPLKIDSREIRFTQDSIRKTFKNGQSLQQTIDDLKAGKLSADDFPPIRVFEVEGELFSLDNRRLYAFQQARLVIEPTAATQEEIERESIKFTTKTGGTTIRLREE